MRRWARRQWGYDKFVLRINVQWIQTGSYWPIKWMLYDCKLWRQCCSECIIVIGTYNGRIVSYNLWTNIKFNTDLRLKRLHYRLHQKQPWYWIFYKCHLSSVTGKKLPNVYKSCPKMNVIEKWKILTPLQKLPKSVGNLGKISVTAGFEKLPKLQ